jgi:hypothetical protein
MKRKKADWFGHIFHTKYLLKHAIEGHIEGRMELTVRKG